MNKLLGICTVIMVMILVGCNSNNGTETTCRLIDETWGDEFIYILNSDDGEITAATIKEIIDVTDWLQDEIDEEIEWITSDDDELTCEHSGNSITCSATFTPRGLAERDITLDLETFILAIELSGGSCE